LIRFKSQLNYLETQLVVTPCGYFKIKRKV
jgi:hypothetical protein